MGFMHEDLALLTDLIIIACMMLQAVEISWIIYKKLFGHDTKLPREPAK